MRPIPESQIVARVRAENPWWEAPHEIDSVVGAYRRRAYFDNLYALVKQTEVRRAVVLMGPRRVGKTVLIHHIIDRLIADGVPPKSICYLSVDQPIYNNLGLDQLLDYYSQASGIDPTRQPTYVFFDEIQYLKGWETHVKTMVDRLSKVKCTVSGSAAAALRLKSTESGAGRFTDFLLPPLTFHEFLMLLDKTDLIGPEDHPVTGFYTTPSIEQLNEQFINYLNYGGYPEAITSAAIQEDPQRYIKSDIVDKVLLRDLPSLYGIEDIQELNYLFTTLAFNTAQEVSLSELSQNAGVTTNTLKRYIEYLEAAFLIKVVHRIDRKAKRFKRATHFKVYLTNPSIRSALFARVGPDDPSMGHLAETAIFSQLFHGTLQFHYARWDGGEVDIVRTHADQAIWAVEAKWSDRYVESPRQLKSLLAFCKSNAIGNVGCTTRTARETRKVDDITIDFVPTSLYCYTVGHNIVKSKTMGPSPYDVST